MFPNLRRSKDEKTHFPYATARCAHPPERPEPVSLFIASSVSGTETTFESAPFAPASIARAATVWSRYAVKTSVGMLPEPRRR
jgi:hypothetical protein